MIVRPTEPFVALSAETAAWLESNANMRALRVRARGVNPRVAQELLDLREVALEAEAALVAQAQGVEPQVAQGLEQEQLLTTGQVAEREGITPAAVRLACKQGRIEAIQSAGRWQITADAYKTYRAARAA